MVNFLTRFSSPERTRYIRQEPLTWARQAAPGVRCGVARLKDHLPLGAPVEGDPTVPPATSAQGHLCPGPGALSPAAGGLRVWVSQRAPRPAVLTPEPAASQRSWPTFHSGVGSPGGPSLGSCQAPSASLGAGERPGHQVSFLVVAKLGRCHSLSRVLKSRGGVFRSRTSPRFRRPPVRTALCTAERGPRRNL